MKGMKGGIEKGQECDTKNYAYMLNSIQDYQDYITVSKPLTQSAHRHTTIAECPECE